MPLEWWISAILAMTAIALSPGNGAILSLRYGLQGGFWYMSPVVLGLQIGLLSVYGLVLAVLFVFSTHISPWFLDGVAVLGGAYLCYLGVGDFIRGVSGAGGGQRIVLSEEPGKEPGKAPPREGVFRRIITGALTNLTNPKGILFMVAFFPQWLKAEAPWPLAWQAFALGAIAVCVDTLVMHGYGGLASTLRRFVNAPWFYRGVDIFLGGVLCAVGLGMVVLRFRTGSV